MRPIGCKATGAEGLCSHPIVDDSTAIEQAPLRPVLPRRGEVDVDRVLPSVPRDQYEIFASVERPRHRGPWLRVRMNLLSALAGHLRAQKGFADPTVLNFGSLLDEDGTFALDRHPVVFVMGGHVENPVDSLAVISQWRKSPWIGRGREARYFVPHFMKRLDEDLSEKVASAVFPELVCQVDVRSAKGTTSEAREERKRRNHSAVRRLAEEVLGRAEQQVIYIEGTCTGNGRICVRKTSGLDPFARAGGKPVAMELATHTYEPLTAGLIRPFINCRKSLVHIAESVDREHLARALEIELSRLNVLTTTGITGAYLLRARDAGSKDFSLGTMRRVVGEVVTRARAARERGEVDLEIDPVLLDPTTREQAISTAFEKLVSTAFDRGKNATYLVPDPATGAFQVTGALGKTADLESQAPDESDIVAKLQRRDPLCYWGNRLNQHMRNEPVLKRIGDEVFAPQL